MNNHVSLQSPISSDEAKTVLDPHLPLLARSLHEGWNYWVQYRDCGEPYAIPLDPSAVAMLVNRYIWHRIYHNFKDVPGVRFDTVRGQRILVIGDKLTIRFKKFDDRLRSRNIPTKQQQAFDLQLPLIDVPPCPRLTFGYVLDPLQANIDRLAVTLPLGKALAWSFIIPEVETEIEIMPLRMPVEVETRLRRVTVKQSGEDQETAL